MVGGVGRGRLFVPTFDNTYSKHNMTFSADAVINYQITYFNVTITTNVLINKLLVPAAF